MNGVPIIVKSVPLRSVGMIVERGNNEWLEKLQFTQSTIPLFYLHLLSLFVFNDM
jgi:hypothetical protein